MGGVILNFLALLSTNSAIITGLHIFVQAILTFLHARHGRGIII